VRTIVVVDAGNVDALAPDVVPDAVVVDASVDALRILKADDHPLAHVPVVMLIEASDAQTWLAAAIEGAVCVVSKPVDTKVLARVLDDALAPCAPPEAEQRYRARVEALEAIARFEAHGLDHVPEAAPARVHLTRLEHRPAPAPDPVGAHVRRRFEMCTDHQRSLVEVIAREGSVTRAAAVLETNRSSVYASLRRIVHRMHLRDTAELLRLVDAGELP
jgi:DNA-binding NarL/FixJ family response regulator